MKVAFPSKIDISLAQALRSYAHEYLALTDPVVLERMCTKIPQQASPDLSMYFFTPINQLPNTTVAFAIGITLCECLRILEKYAKRRTELDEKLR